MSNPEDDKQKKKPEKSDRTPDSTEIEILVPELLGKRADGAGAREAAREKAAEELPTDLPILPLRNAVLFPGTVLPLSIGRPQSIRLVDQALARDRHLGLVAQKDAEVEEPGPDDFYSVGAAGTVLRLVKLPDGTQSIIVQGLRRFRIEEITSREPYYRARVTYLEDLPAPEKESEALLLGLKELASKVIDLAPNIPTEANLVVQSMSDAGTLADFLTANLGIPVDKKQEILEELPVRQRAEAVSRLLTREIEVLELSNKIQSEVKDSMEKTQREFFLREQMKAIQRELGDKDERTVEIEELEKRIAEADLPDEARKEAEREIKRLARMPPGAAEYTVSRTYVDWLLELPWRKYSEDQLDIGRARDVLEEDHYDLDKVKKRILEYLAVRKLRPEAKGPILCLVGPPGVGKTSLGRSVARALGRKFIRVSLGGLRDEAEIRGHRRTYVGALPGRIIQYIRKAGTANPVFMLDEIDKVGMDYIRGDPASALLEVLDPEQNNSFSDYYLEVPFDLSKVLFIATANIIEPVPPALKDRLEVLELPGYTEEEKLGIARRYLLPRQLTEHGLTEKNLLLDDEAIRAIIRSYTREAGVRNLERDIAAVCRGVARRVAEAEVEQVAVKTEGDLYDYLGPIRFFQETAERCSSPGVATGLAWTPTGGELMFIEVTSMPGKGSLILTGHLGDVMRESAQAALSYLRSIAGKLHLPEKMFLERDIHIHVPAGAIPKDGPSAGITIFTALASLFANRPVRSDMALTGEITLRGQVLPIGGVKEKTLAAARGGISTVILPEKNRKDLEEIPSHVREGMKFVFVSQAEELLTIAIAQPGEKRIEEGPARARVSSEAGDTSPSPPCPPS